MTYNWLARSPDADAPLVSVVTVVRRDFTGLDKTLGSLAAISDLSTEVVVIEGDDASWPEADALLAREAQRIAALSWSRTPDAGIYDAMNRGASAARGEWLWFVNAGDAVVADGWSVLREELRTTSADWVVASARVTDEAGATLRYKCARDFSLGALRRGEFMPCHQAVFVRRRTFLHGGGYDPSLTIAADYKLLLALAEHAGEALVRDRVVVDFVAGGVSELRRERLLWQHFRARDSVLTRGQRARVADAGRALRRMLSITLRRRARLARLPGRDRQRPQAR